MCVRLMAHYRELNCLSLPSTSNKTLHISRAQEENCADLHTFTKFRRYKDPNWSSLLSMGNKTEHIAKLGNKTEQWAPID
jgi:hypothetical protein